MKRLPRIAASRTIAIALFSCVRDLLSHPCMNEEMEKPKEELTTPPPRIGRFDDVRVISLSGLQEVRAAE